MGVVGPDIVIVVLIVAICVIQEAATAAATALWQSSVLDVAVPSVSSHGMLVWQPVHELVPSKELVHPHVVHVPVLSKLPHVGCDVCKGLVQACHVLLDLLLQLLQ